MHLHTKFQVSSIILTGFRRGDLILLPPPNNKPLKSPPRIDLNAQFMKYVAIYEIFICLLAPVQVSVPVDVKSEAATGKMFNT